MPAPSPAAINWGSAPATERALSWIADLGREGVVRGRPLTWAEASLVLDESGETLSGWLRKQGATAHQAQGRGRRWWSHWLTTIAGTRGAAVDAAGLIDGLRELADAPALLEHGEWPFLLTLARRRV